MAAAQFNEQVQQAYLAYYGRPADPAGQAFWANQLSNANGNMSAIINAFGTSAESTALYSGSNAAAQVNAIYNQLFGRNADVAGLNFYVNALNQGTFTLASIALNVYNGAQGTDATELTAKLAYADAFTLAVGQSTQAQVAYSGTAASNNARAAVASVVDTTSGAAAQAALATTVANIGGSPAVQTFTLTTGVDSFTPTGNSVINGTIATSATAASNAPTFTNLDSIAATGTNNTLNLSDLVGGTSLPLGTTVSGVQTVNLTSVAAGAGITGDNFTGFTGLTTLNVKELGGTGIGSGITAAGTTAVNVNDVAQTGGNINVLGGSNVAVTAAGVTTGAITVGSTTAAPTGTITVTATDAAVTQVSAQGVVTNTAGQITTNGGTTVSVTQNITAPVVTGTTGTQATDVGGAVMVNGTATTSSVTVNQTAAVAAVQGAAAQVAAPATAATDAVTFTALGAVATVGFNGVTVTSVAGVSAALVATLFAAEASGNAASILAATNAITTADAGATVLGTWGAGKFLATTTTAGSVVTFTSATTGSGALNIPVGGTSGATRVFVDGTNATVTAPAVAAVGGIADGAVTVQDVNFGSTTKAGTITTVSLNNFSNGATINDTGLTSLTLAGTGGAVLINEAGSLASQAVTTLNLNANAVTGATAAVTDAGIKTLNVVTGGAAASTLSFADTALTTVNVSGTQSINLTQNASALAAINVSGGAGVTATIGASTAFAATGTGNDVVTLNGALTKTSGGSISFGSGNNSLLSAGGSIASGVTVNGGTGGLNTISASLVNAGNAAGISNFQVLDVSNFGSGAGNGSLDASLLATAVSGVAISSAGTSGTATLLNLGGAVTVTDAANGSVSNLVLTHSAGSGTLAVNFADAASVPTFEAIASLTSTGDTSISVGSAGTKGTANFITNLVETDNHLTTVTITGSNAFTLSGIHTNAAATATTATTTASSLTTIDGSAATGALNITAGTSDINGTVTTTYSGLTIKGGIGGDTITNHAASGVIIEGATASTLVNHLMVDGNGGSINDAASAGADVVSLSGFGESATLGSGKGVALTVQEDTFGAGGVTAKLGDTANVTFGSGTATVTDNLHYNVTGSSTNTSNTNGDVLTLNGTLHGQTVSFVNVVGTAGALGAAASVAAAQTFDQAVFLADHQVTAGVPLAANSVTWFQYAGNTYVEATGANVTAGAQDAQVVKIAGAVDLSHAVVTTGAHGSVAFA